MSIAKKVKQAGFVIALAATAVSVTAQDDREKGNRDGNRGGMNMERMTETLALTEEQVAQIQELIPTRQRSRNDEDNDTTTRANSDTRTARRAEIEASLEAILTAEQFVKYKEFAANRQGRGQRGSKDDVDEGA